MVRVQSASAAVASPRSKRKINQSTTTFTLNTSPNTSHLIAPHGGELVNLILNREQAADAKAESRDFPSWDLTARQICDAELLL
ncbi:MAG: hypothetical protein H0U23_05990, partial [Blastocatellia bacterium]|nr:hypothetical protein [Blastocatellia bacterium]